MRLRRGKKCIPPPYGGIGNLCVLMLYAYGAVDRVLSAF